MHFLVETGVLYGPSETEIKSKETVLLTVNWMSWNYKDRLAYQAMLPGQLFLYRTDETTGKLSL